MQVVEANKVASVFFTGPRKLFQGPGWLYLVEINAESAGATNITVYDGSDSLGARKLELTCPANNSKQFKPSFPIYINYAVYAAVGDNFMSGFVQILPI